MTSMTNSKQGRAVVGWLIFIAIILMAWGGTYGWKSIQCGRQVRDRTDQLAQSTAHAIAVFGSTQVIAGDWGELQRYADDLVKEKPLAYVAIVNARGIAVVHTDGSFRGQRFEKPKTTRQFANASVPVMNLTKKEATVWVGANVGP